MTEQTCFDIESLGKHYKVRILPMLFFPDSEEVTQCSKL